MQSIGVIGGADGPTSVFVSSGTNYLLIALGVVAVVILGVIIFKVLKK